MKEKQEFIIKGKQEFIIHDGLEGLRIYTVISLVAENEEQQKYSFYRSTGRNSKYTDTWFPFAEKEPMRIKKPNEIPGYRVFDNYPQSFLDFSKQKFDSHTLAFENGYNELLHRFGNFECMCVSYLLNGGYWIHDDSRILREYLNQNYSQELEILTTSIKHFDSFKNPTGISVTGRQLYWDYRQRYHDDNLKYSQQLFNYPEIPTSLINDTISNDSLSIDISETIQTKPYLKDEEKHKKHKKLANEELDESNRLDNNNPIFFASEYSSFWLQLLASRELKLAAFVLAAVGVIALTVGALAAGNVIALASTLALDLLIAGGMALGTGTLLGGVGFFSSLKLQTIQEQEESSSEPHFVVF